MKFLFKLLVLFLLSSTAMAQNSFHAIIKSKQDNDPIDGATALLLGTDNGVQAAENGQIEIKNIPNGKQVIVFSRVGYETLKDTLNFPLASPAPVIILLSPATPELSEVFVTTTRTNSRIEDIPLRVEVIGHEEVNEEVNIKPTNISKLLLESTSIQAQQTSAVNGNVSIRMQGLDGKYTQILKDGFPLYGGFAQGLSIMQIPPLDLKQIEIIKGSASSLYGSDAIAGIINLISKQPEKKRELTFLVNQTSLQGTDVNGYLSQRWDKFGFSLLTSNNFQSAVDVNKDGFSDLPRTQTLSLNPTFYYYFDPSATLRFGVNGTLDSRKGGDMQVLRNLPDSLHQYFEEDISNRVSSQLKFDKQFGTDKSFTFKNSVGYFNRSIDEPLSAFAGNQLSSYTEASFNFKVGRQQFVTGLNFTTEKFSEDSIKSHHQRNYDYNTTGFFLQDDWKPTEKLALQAGLRVDYQNKFGFFALPRLSIMYKFTKDFYVRAGSGFGYKVPSIFSTASEQAGINNVLPLSSTIKAEKSIGSNLDFNYKTRIGDEGFVTLNQSFFLTQITDPLVLNGFQFVNEPKPILTSGFESNVRYTLGDFQVFGGYTFVDARRKYDSMQSFVPLTPKHKINLDFIYEKEDNFSVALEGYYISSMFRDFDTKTKDYFTLGFIAQKHFEHFSIIANCENLFDVRQSRFENMVIPPTGSPTFRQVYAPLEGRVFNVALRITL